MLSPPLIVSRLLKRCFCLLQMEKYFSPQRKKLPPQRNDLLF
jgi:hypothetical protein